MGLYPYNTNLAQSAQTDAPDAAIETSLLRPVRYALGSPAVPDVDYLVTATNMIVGAYTLANTTLAVARNVTVTVTAADTADTMGTVDIVGTDINGDALTETITPSAGSTVAGNKAFKTITSATGVGWVIDGAEGSEDQISIGFGDKLGLPDKLAYNSVLAAHFGGVKESTAPTVTVSSSVLASNTVDLNSASDGSAIVIDYLV